MEGLGRPPQVRHRWDRDAETAYTQWRRQVRSGLRRLQDSYLELYRSTALFRIYSSTLVPGLLQTEGYAGGILHTSARLHDVPVDDSAQAARARVERSRIIHEPGHRLVAVIEEAALRHQLRCRRNGGPARLPLDRRRPPPGLRRHHSLGLPSRGQWPRETFHVYDDRLVSVELVSARVRITQPDEIALYLKAFEQLRGAAVYGAEARPLIAQAIDALH